MVVTYKQELTLAFESSCDETCAAVVDGDLRVLSNVVASQIDIHKRYGGVVPEIASRNHAMAIQAVCEEALEQAGVGLGDIAQVAATTGPGLRGAVMVGQVFAESLATARKIPFVEVNHLCGHISSVMLKSDDEYVTPELPFVALLVSGGHTSLYSVKRWDKIELLCETSDDACGEAFDKVAKLLGLGYPGGVQIEKFAEQYKGTDFIQFVSKPSKKDGFSYSGLKTAVLNYLNTIRSKGVEVIDLPRVCASFQREAVEQLVSKTMEQLRKYKIKTVCVCGGVSANNYLRKRMAQACAEIGARVIFPEWQYCTDNAAMVGAAAILGCKL